MKILVTGATGTIGREVTLRLADERASVHAMVRNPERALDLKESGVRLVPGNFEAPATLDAALAGINRVLLLSSFDPRQVELQGNLVEAAKRAGVERIVKISAAGTSPDSEIEFLRMHAQTERQIEESGLGWTHLHPTFFMQNLLQSATTVRDQGVVYGAYGEAPVNFVDARDIAVVAARTLVDDGHERQIYTVTGPENLAMTDVASRLGRVLGKEVRYVDLPVDQFHQGMLDANVPRWAAENIAGLATAARAGRMQTKADVIEQVGRKKPYTFDEFARDHDAAFLEP